MKSVASSQLWGLHVAGERVWKLILPTCGRPQLEKYQNGYFGRIGWIFEIRECLHGFWNGKCINCKTAEEAADG